MAMTVEGCIRYYDDLQNRLSHLESDVLQTEGRLGIVEHEQELINSGIEVLKQVRPLIAADSIKQAEALANQAISSIFGFNANVRYDVESKSFVVKRDGFDVSLQDCGGGFVTVVSFVFTVYLLMKLGRRRFMAYDEAFTQISTEYFDNFLVFVRKLCSDLKIDLLLISHDDRITNDDVDHVYQIKDGMSIKLK